MNYLNTDRQMILFQEILNNPLYVDKSLLIADISKRIRTDRKYVCITRPRRFGKSVNANMLGTYYTKGLESTRLFHGYAVEHTKDYKKHINQHNVVSIDLSRLPSVCKSYHDYISYIKENLFEDMERAYNLQRKKNEPVEDLLHRTGDSFIFILDEWDAVFYRKFMKRAEKEEYLLFLKLLFKDQPYVELVYMTGVLPITKYSSGSELNMFVEYNIINDTVFNKYFGFQESEVKALCQKSQTVSFEEVQLWYDGYYTSDGSHLFNPRSVIMALLDGVCRNYWTETGPMNEIANCIEHNVNEVRDDIIKMVSQIPVEIRLEGYSVTEQELHTRDEILSAMVVYGFLSYYDGSLCIPNRELMEKFQKVLTRESFGEVREIVKQSKEMLEATIAGDEDRVAEMIEYVHDKEIPILKYNDENSLSYVITLCYLSARDYYIVERELHAGKGYCDFIFIPRKQGKPGIVIEFKMGSSCENAIQQIKDKNYMQRLENCKEILLVGINYNKEKHHECKIEKYKEKSEKYK